MTPQLTLQQYAEDGASDAEDTSDEEDAITDERNHPPRHAPSSSTSRPSRRSRPSSGETHPSRTSTRAAEPVTNLQYAQQPGPTPTATTHTTHPSTRPDLPPSPATTPNDWYSTSRPPQQAPPPPPPPRPVKERAEDDNHHNSPAHHGRPYSPVAPRAPAARNSQASVLPPEQYHANAYASNNPYVPAETAEFEAARRQGRRASGRG